MSEVQAIILGILQGITEFLPVSSSGHLTLAQHFFGLVGSDNIPYDLAVHVGTVCSVLTVYHRSVRKIIGDAIWSIVNRKKSVGGHFALMVVVASIPTAIIGLGFKKMFEQMFSNLFVVGAGFAITAILLYFTRGRGKGEMGSNFLEFEGPIDINWRQALLVGLAQGIAITPGISRSGSTIGAGMLVGLTRKSAALFSFMMAIPAILGAAALELRHVENFSSHEIQSMLIGFAAAYMAGLVGLKLVLSFVREGRIHLFSFYLVIVSAVTIAIACFGGH